MIKLSGIFSESFGSTCVIRGFAKYTDIVKTSYPHPDYQRPEDEKHIEDISHFIISGSNSFSPEVVLAYTAQYDYYATGANSEVDALSDIRNGKGFVSNVNGVSLKKIRAVENGYLYEMNIPDSEGERPFRRIDGNHRLKAFEKLIENGQVTSSYFIPFCIILFSEGSTLKDEKTIFHNINSKALPIKSEQLLRSVIIESHNETDFSDNDLCENFGFEYLLARKLISTRPLVVRKLKYIQWIKYNLLTVLVDLVSFVSSKEKIDTKEKEDAFFEGLSRALDHTTTISKCELAVSSGLFYLLVLLYYKIYLNCFDEEKNDEKYKNNLLAWVEKYQVTDLQNDSPENATANALCIKGIFQKYIDATENTIFISRCFACEYDENEYAIRRTIDEINTEKNILLKVTRVDQGSEGTTGQISDRVFRDIANSGLVIADLSSGRPNIPHEIGYAMGLNKGLIIIHNGTDEDADEHTPSNIKMFEQIRYNGEYQKLHDELKRKIIDYYKL